VFELFLHFLMVAATLLGFPRGHKEGHGLKYFIHSPHVFVQEVMMVDLQKPVISLIFLDCPVAEVLICIPYVNAPARPTFLLSIHD
jgi:hypothetical protein